MGIENIFNIILIIMIIMFIAFAVYVYIKQEQFYKTRKHNMEILEEKILKQQKEDILYNLGILKNVNSSSNEKAASFLDLIELKYVKIHTLIYEDKCDYKDQLQSKKFRDSLNNQTIQRLNEMDSNTMRI